MLNFIDTNLVIDGQVDNEKLNLSMQVFQENHINTRTLPSTYNVLESELPSIFKCECFNDGNKNFKEESQQTELGHLFEHIMLEYLCIEKLGRGSETAEYEGVTKWNWMENKIGTFNIEINIGQAETEFIEQAFDKSIKLLGKIMS